MPGWTARNANNERRGKGMSNNRGAMANYNRYHLHDDDDDDDDDNSGTQTDSESTTTTPEDETTTVHTTQTNHPPGNVTRGGGTKPMNYNNSYRSSHNSDNSGSNNGNKNKSNQQQIHHHESRTGVESVSKSSANQREPVPLITTSHSNGNVSFAPMELAPTPIMGHRSTQQQQHSSVVTPRSQVMDLKHNDNSFHVIAKLIIDRFEDQLNLQSESITIGAGDRFHLDRVVQSKNNFIEAVQYRLKENCPEHSTKPIHWITRQCRAIGLHLDGSKNPLNAPVGSVIQIDWSDRSMQRMASIQTIKPDTPDHLARQQLLAELREASNLMAESVTPEASQFWRRHVIELQAKLRALHEKGIDSSSASRNTNLDAEDIMKNNERLLASLWQDTGYVPPNQDEMLSTASMNNSVYPEARAHGQQRNVNTTDPRNVDLPVVDVVAPADLPGGYQFEAEINGRHFLATVPTGGVRKGQTFSCHMRDVQDTDIPYGHWRDGLYDCKKHGLFHPMLLNSTFCPLLALAQVMQRLGLDVTGKRASADTPSRGLWSTHGMMVSIIVCWVGLNALIISGFEFKMHQYVSLSSADIFSLILVNGSMVFFAMFATIRTRSFIRERYNIHQREFRSGVEDVASTVFCLPLSIAQMGRHTTCYDEYDGVCCNETGVVEHPQSRAGIVI